MGVIYVELILILYISVSSIPEASPRSEKPLSTTDQVTAMCQQMSLELAFLTNSTDNDVFPEKLKSNNVRSLGELMIVFIVLELN